MSILTHLVDRHTVSRAGDLNKGVTVVSYAHSLPATQGEVGFAAIRSIEEMGTGSGQGQIDMFVVGSNASLSSVGYRGAFSNASTPAIMADIVQIVFHSLIR